MDKSSTSKKILVYIQEHETASAAECSRFLGLTPAAVRYHIQDLLRRAEIEPSPTTPFPLPVPGRPAHRYQISKARIPENTSRLAAASLALLFPSDLSRSDADKILLKIARQLAIEYIPPAQASHRLRAAIIYLNSHGYDARWEAHAGGPRILFRTCPYRSLLPAFPQICSLDQHLLQILVGAPFDLTAQMGKGQPVVTHCLFTLSPNLL